MSVVMLNSGGFDSSVLSYLVRELFPKEEIYAIFFNHGQNSAPFERKWAKYHSDANNIKFYEIELPKFSWSNGSFYSKDFVNHDKHYLEWRNLVFLSYAFSFAQAKGADLIYLATLKSYGYCDTSKRFFSIINCLDDEIKVVTPFSDMEKADLVPLAFQYKVKSGQFNSCDYTIDGNSCGKCEDCVAIEKLGLHSPISKFYMNDGKYTLEVEKAFTESEIKIDEVRLLVNNDCQLNCKHCFYGFKAMHSDRISVDDFVKSAQDAYNLGCRKFHLSGKEPLYDDFWFKVSKELRNKLSYGESIEISLVTNGINVRKYESEIGEVIDRVMISVDNIGQNDSLYRVTTDKTSLDAIQTVKRIGKPFEVFFTLHKNNMDTMIKDAHICCSLGAAAMCVTVPKIVGNAVENGINKEDLQQFGDFLIKLSQEKFNGDFYVYVIFGAYYTNKLLESGHPASKFLKSILSTGNHWVSDYLYLLPEWFCQAFSSQITITPDGYVLGCGADVSDPNYWKNFMNVKYHSLENIVTNYRKKVNTWNEEHFPCIKCRAEDNITCI